MTDPVEYISIKIVDLPKYTHASKKFRSLKENELGEVMIEKYYVKASFIVNTLKTFYSMAELIIFWEFDQIPASFIDYSRNKENFNLILKDVSNKENNMYIYQLLFLTYQIDLK